MIEEHFRRSLGKNYKEPEPTSTNSVSITGSVDDHFAKALGDTWLQIKNKGSPSSSGSSPNSSPDSHMVNHNHSPSVVSWKGKDFSKCPQPSQSSQFQHPLPWSVTSVPEGMPAHWPAKNSQNLQHLLFHCAFTEDQLSNKDTATLTLCYPLVCDMELNWSSSFHLPVIHQPCMWSLEPSKCL